MSKTLVAFFSATGTTAAIAKMIAGLTKADIFEIEPAQPYSSADLDWNDKNSRTTIEQKDNNARPALARKIGNIDEYGTIFLGFPIWWYGAPKIIFTFLESADFNGKTIIPFVTSGSSGPGNIPAQLKEICPGANWQPCKRFPAGAAQKEVEAFVEEHTGWKN